MNEGKRGDGGRGLRKDCGGDGAQRRQTKPMLGPLLYSGAMLGPMLYSGAMLGPLLYSGAMLGPMLSILEAYHSPPFWGGVRGRGFSFTKYTQTGR